MAGSVTISPCGTAIPLPRQTEGERNMVVLGAARLGKTRLIDNLELNAGN